MMRALIQRVTRAKVTVAGAVVGEISEPGLLVLVGVKNDDAAERAAIEKVSRKIAQLKILRGPDGDDDARQSAEEAGAPILMVSQFTLYADVRKGTKPGWSHAAPGPVAEPIFNALVEAVRARGLHVETGQFGAMMDVELVNDGPFTILVEVPE